MTGAAAWAQANVADQQLASGVLRDQNLRLTSQDGPAEDSFTSRAAEAIARKDFGRALAILRPYRLTQPLAYRYLAGQAYEGRGDYPAARKEFAAAIKMRKNFTAAQVALAVIEAGHGDRAAAVSILQDLTARRAACAGKCAAAAELAGGIPEIEAALKARPG